MPMTDILKGGALVMEVAYAFGVKESTICSVQEIKVKVKSLTMSNP